MELDFSKLSERDLLIFLIEEVRHVQATQHTQEAALAKFDERLRSLEDSRTGFTAGWKLVAFLLASPPLAAVGAVLMTLWAKSQ